MDADHRGPDGLDLETLARDLGRVGDRLRSMSDVRLTQRDGFGAMGNTEGTRAAAALDLAQQLADAAAGVERRTAITAPAHRVVPDLGVFALGDQVTVTGHDLVEALRHVAPDDLVWGPEGHATAAELLEQLAQKVQDFRLRL